MTRASKLKEESSIDETLNEASAEPMHEKFDEVDDYDHLLAGWSM